MNDISISDIVYVHAMLSTLVSQKKSLLTYRANTSPCANKVYKGRNNVGQYNP